MIQSLLRAMFFATISRKSSDHNISINGLTLNCLTYFAVPIMTQLIENALKCYATIRLKSIHYIPTCRHETLTVTSQPNQRTFQNALLPPNPIPQF